MRCTTCGAEQSLEAVRRGTCEYCAKPLPNAVDAAAKAAAMRELLADRDGDGLPDALAQLEAAQQRQSLLREGPGRLVMLQAERSRAAGARANPLMPLLLSLPAVALCSGLWLGLVQAAGTDPWLGGFCGGCMPKGLQ